ncbi:MAG: UDP-N-acetylmuramoyl-L-alanine--D-glutamate ligase [Desulfobacterales bacterium]|nr:UDP-N-acetylmuramoyl-L-alanine--D-glutamate ligase [Desulfobacterales bacterium]
MELTDKNILIVGLGKSGAAIARFLKNRGCGSVTVTDMANEDQVSNYASLMREMDVRTELGQHRTETFEKADLIVLSPGVPHTIKPIKAAREKGIPVLGEIELACRFISEPIIAITGTNGKTTTATLLGEMLKKSGFNVFVGGNIGDPLIGYADKGEKADILVVEVSSFQLDTIETFRPKVAVLLNITDDHLDRYPDFNAYAMSKCRIFENQEQNDFAVFSNSDPLISSMAKNIKSRKLETGNWKLETGNWKLEIKFQVSSFNLSNPGLPGRHNRENVSAACMAALAVGGTPEGIQTALDNFKGLRHRLEYVTTINNARYFNDSKGTNTDATAKALEYFTEPVILIMGGRSKGGSQGHNQFNVLKDTVRQKVKRLIIMGEASGEIKTALGHECRGGSQLADSMDDAVFQAYQASDPGDVVLLSPGCSSFDMYNSYAERGEHFCKATGNLKK